jgi:hypothetical protein
MPPPPPPPPTPLTCLGVFLMPTSSIEAALVKITSWINVIQIVNHMWYIQLTSLYNIWQQIVPTCFVFLIEHKYYLAIIKTLHISSVIISNILGHFYDTTFSRWKFYQRMRIISASFGMRWKQSKQQDRN